jgi:hypothetical protein
MPRPSTKIHQTGRTLNVRCRTQIHTIRNNRNSGYSDHILNKGHANDEIITDTVDIIKTGKKDKHLNTLEKISHL